MDRQTKYLKKLILLVLIFMNQPSFVFSQNGMRKIEFEVCIDGRNLLCLQDDKMWWERVSGKPPGTPAAHCNNETTVDGRSWKTWKKPFKLRFSLNNDSLIFVEKISSYECCIKMRPTEENNWKTEIEFYDEISNGPITYTLILVFREPPGHKNNQKQTKIENEKNILQDCVKKEKQKKTEIQKVKQEFEKQEDVRIEKNQPFVLNNIYFDTNKPDLLPSSFAELDRVLKELVKNDFKFVISGHTDNSGDPAKNLKLSEDRAKSVYNYFLEKGIEAKRVTYIGHGDKFPIDSNNSDEGKRKNRRVELKIND